MPVPDRVGVVILHWHTEEPTLACIKSIGSNQTPSTYIYIVDNGSSPGFRNRVLQVSSCAVILGDGTNLGFAAGANLGARRALDDGCTQIVFLNNDTVLSGDALQILSRDAFGIVNPRILSDRNRDEVWFDGGRISFGGKGVHQDIGRPLGSLRNKPERETTTFATACAMLIRKETFELIGSFDERLFAYGEDLDLSIRAARANVSIGINRGAIVFHGESHSVRSNVGKNFRDYYVLRNALLLLKKHFLQDKYLIRLAFLLATDFCIPFVFFLMTFQPKRVQALILGLRDGLIGIGGRSPRWN